ncbi:nucleotidyltransferase family protein [Glaciecola sp. 33A]|jgi:molybdenum cofactor cytidylyltransferase|nr:nucleotidyltransferase family protein [Glaciecola sp. 33A]
MTNIMTSKRLSCVLLAAGLSSRMGEQNKLLINIEGQSLVRRTAQLLVDYGLDEIVVVVGHEATLVASELIDLPVSLVENHDYREGQMTSVYTGIKSLTKNTDGIIICLADLVLLDKADLYAMHLAFDKCTTSILVPQYLGERGNPIILDHSQRQAILNGEKNLGCRKLIQKQPQEVTVFEAQNDHVTFDLDTPEALQNVRQRLQHKEYDTKQPRARNA